MSALLVISATMCTQPDVPGMHDEPGHLSSSGRSCTGQLCPLSMQFRLSYVNRNTEIGGECQDNSNREIPVADPPRGHLCALEKEELQCHGYLTQGTTPTLAAIGKISSPNIPEKPTLGV